MKHVFIAVGGSGTKVAEALVRLLAVGFPTRSDNGFLTSAGDKLEIWRIDPDQGAGAQEDLIKCLAAYKNLQSSLSDGAENNSVASSRWAMDIETRLRELNPLELPNADENQMKTLGGILDSGRAEKKSLALLAPFYEQKDLDVWVDRGFYQKPYIGAAIMSVFARSLEDDSTPAGKKAGLTAFSNTPTNFFLCGSLHGGTGACGVPVMAQFLNRRKNANPGWGWRVGGCLLAPFVKPPMPPFSPLREGDTVDEDGINQLLEIHGSAPAFQDMTPEEKRQLVRQILLGFYADPDDMEARARQGLTFYQDHSADYFDELYLVGKPSPNQLKTWSNGGKSQKNPLNSADTVAAIAALNFFANAGTGDKSSYVIGSSGYEVPQENMRLFHAPSYRIGKDVEINAEKVFLATALTAHLIRHQLPWNRIHESAKDFLICDYYDKRGGQTIADKSFYENSLNKISETIYELIRPHHEQFPTGWSGEEAQQISKFLDANENSDATKEVREKMGKKMLSREAKGVNALGQSEAKFTWQDFGAWCPPGDQFTRGEYLRHVWQQVFARCQTQLGN